MRDPSDLDWPRQLHETLRALDTRCIAHVPDAGHAQLINYCAADPAMRVVGLTTEQDGVGLLCGAWSGGVKGVLLMQSSGVGNVVNALALAATCRVPLVMIVSMRGEWGEFIPWQVPMGQATPAVFEAMQVSVFRADSAGEVAGTVHAAATLAFNTRRSVAVLLSQKMLGAKAFVEG